MRVGWGWWYLNLAAISVVDVKCKEMAHEFRMKLPHAEKALIPSAKIRDYLLSFSHPVGRFKAAFFQSLGYSASDWNLLSEDLRSFLQKQVHRTEKSEYGCKYEINGPLTGPFNKTAYIVTVWIILDGEERPRFVTAYPGDEI
ncbi:hypothetical protein MNBD_GAMMA26-345 [hydrothermal vent metagenome]|uniref:DUF6883 domain-containing protein n=1 Tax=hydrothermal vent metagenome TaxID=652676 RepID=A0A3B1BY49_9ZZZZ